MVVNENYLHLNIVSRNGVNNTIGYQCSGHNNGSHTVYIVSAVPPPVAAVLMISNPLPYFGESPVNMTCPHCNDNIITVTRYETGMLTWLACGGICLFM